MREILSIIKSDKKYVQDPLVYIANLSCELIQDMIELEEMDTVQEISAVISFGELLLYSCLSNLQFEDEEEIGKIYNLIHENYERSECHLRQSIGGK